MLGSMGRMWKETRHGLFYGTIQHLPGWSEENYKKSLSVVDL